MFQIKVLELLVKHEGAMAGLYKLYSQKFPKYKKFWSDLVSDELMHASIIKGFYSKIEDDGFIYFSAEKFRKEEIESSLIYISDKMVGVQEKEISIKDALSATLKIEKGLIESHCLDVFWTESENRKLLLQKLIADTERHRDKVEKAIELIDEKS